MYCKRIGIFFLVLVMLLSGCRGGSGESMPTITADMTTPSDTAAPESTRGPLPEPEDQELVRVADHIPSAVVALRYATQDNFIGQKVYDFSGAWLRYGTVKKLRQACEQLAQYGLGLKIWDAYRPLSAQEALWEHCPDTRYVSHPQTGNRNHCRGSAVDVTLIDLYTGRELRMPTGFDDFTELADRDYSDCPAAALENVLLLERIMVQCGFEGGATEWWHYADTDTYPVEEDFEPAEDDMAQPQPQKTAAAADSAPEQLPRAYARILENLIGAFPWNDDPEAVVAQNPELSYMYRLYFSLSDIGYAVMDLDGNGQPELLLAGMEDDGIFDLYTLEGEEAVHLFDGGERYRYYLRAGGMVENQWSGSAIMSGNDFFTVSGGQLVFLERIAYDGFHAEDIGLAEDAWEAGPENSYFRSDTREPSDYLHITPQEADELLSSYQNTYPLLEVTYTPLSRYGEE